MPHYGRQQDEFIVQVARSTRVPPYYSRLHPFLLLGQSASISQLKPYGFSGSPQHTLFIFYLLLNCVLKIKITTTTITTAAGRVNY